MGMPIIKPSKMTREEAIADIILSIAAEESAIAHILNAESEKIKKIVDMPDATADDLIAVNRSVKDTVDTIIRLEMTMKTKLAMFGDFICKID